MLRELRPGHQVACHFPVETVTGSIVGPMPDDVAPTLPDQIDVPQATPVIKEMGAGLSPQHLEPTRDNGLAP